MRTQLLRILGSSEFVIPERGRRFLKFVVEETLAGRGDRLKAYTIATQIFGRDESFDAQSDPLVRIEAGRIRRALERYYLVAGKNDLIVTTIPKGGYVPTFELRMPPPPSPGASRVSASQTNAQRPAAGGVGRPAVLIIPFVEFSDQSAGLRFAPGLTAEVVHQLARFKDLMVIVGREADLATGGAAGTAAHEAVRYCLEGSVRSSAAKIRFMTRLIERASGAVLWSAAYDGDPSVSDLIAFQEDVAQRVASAVGQPYGVVFRAHLARVAQHPDDFDAYSCILAYFSYRAELDPLQHASVRAALEQAVERFPNYATAWALLSLTYLHEARFGYNVKADRAPPITRALEAANRAVDCDPENARAHHALSLALFFNRETEAAFAVGERALALNPNDADVCGELGWRHATAGDRTRGIMLLEDALSRNPSHADYLYGLLAAAALFNRDLDKALACIRRASLEKFSNYYLVAAATYGHCGLRDDAQRAGKRFLEMRPNFLRELDAELDMRSILPSDRAYFVEGLRKAGLSI